MSRSIQRIYLERAAADHPRARAVLERLPHAEVIPCERYGEVFNVRRQDFRLQKRRPALILARKHDHQVLEAPEGYGIGGRRNFYFSHMLNCIYDCRYCFLQGMFRSAHYVLFVNYEDFQAAIEERIEAAGGEAAYFFSGYDCDSLALDRLTAFVAELLPFFAARPHAWLELRTKSTQIGSLLEREPVRNCVVAFSLTPPEVHRRFEIGVPSVGRRLEAMQKLARAGWSLGLRFDPLIHTPDFEAAYRRLLARVFGALPSSSIHSVSLGPFRLPKPYFERLYRLYPDERLFAGPLERSGGMVGLGAELERELIGFCTAEILRHVSDDLLFACPNPIPGAIPQERVDEGSGAPDLL